MAFTSDPRQARTLLEATDSLPVRIPAGLRTCAPVCCGVKWCKHAVLYRGHCFLLKFSPSVAGPGRQPTASKRNTAHSTTGEETDRGKRSAEGKGFVVLPVYVIAVFFNYKTKVLDVCGRF